MGVLEKQAPKAWHQNLKFNLCFQDMIRTSLIWHQCNDTQHDKKKKGINKYVKHGQLIKNNQPNFGEKSPPMHVILSNFILKNLNNIS